MVPLRAFRKTLTILAAAAVCAVIASVLPDNPYQRWQLLGGTLHENSRWIYERCHFDPTPIDVVFLGASRTLYGVDAPRIGEALAARGLPARVVNFSFPQDGRNINFVVAKELFSSKRPKLVILGVIERAYRFGHPAFRYLADRPSIVDPSFIGNFDYFPNLAYLPYRQLRLFAADFFPSGSGLTKQFDPAGYQGASTDTTWTGIIPGGRILPATAAPPAELARQLTEFRSALHPPYLPSRYWDLEFGEERFYVDQIADLASKHGARVAFLFQPYYTGPTDLLDLQFYARLGPVLNAGFLAPHSEWFTDYTHLTRDGAHVLSDWLIEPVADLLKLAG